MAPLFLACNQLSYVYSPYTSRSMHNLPGQQSRCVPFMRPCMSKHISKSTTIIKAAAENAVTQSGSNTNNGADGANGTHGNREPKTGLLAVHGGERAGRPRVSGRCFLRRLLASRCRFLLFIRYPSNQFYSSK